MKTLKQLLNELDACNEAVRWAEDKTIEQVIEQCHRGDWLLWLAQKVDIGLHPLTLAKGHCVNTVRHLMKDKRSIKSVDTAIAFGEGKVAITELAAAAATAAFAAADAATTATAAFATAAATDAASAADDAADAAFAAAFAADDAADAAFAAADAAFAAAYAAFAAADADVAAYAAARIGNQQQTADICRQYIGKLIIDKVNELLNKQQDNGK